MSNRKCNVFLNDVASRYKYLQNGLPQGSVLSQILLNVFISYVDDTVSRKFIYADGIALVAQAKDLTKVGDTLKTSSNYKIIWPNRNLLSIRTKQWPSHYTLTIEKHIGNYNLMVGDNHIVNEERPTYLGVRINRCLTFKKHVENVKNKLKTRNNFQVQIEAAMLRSCVYLWYSLCTFPRDWN